MHMRSSVETNHNLHPNWIASSLLFVCLVFWVGAAQSGSHAPSSGSAQDVVQITAEQEQELLAAMAAAQTRASRPRYSPSLGAGVPTGFGANWGDVMIGLSGSNKDDVRDEYDASMSFTMGLGNSATLFGVELSANNLSIRNFGDNWSFNGKVHRMVYQGSEGFVSVALGQNNLACDGPEACSDNKPVDGLAASTASTYGAISAVIPIENPFGMGTRPLSTTFGFGDGFYSSETDSGKRYSPFGDIGIQVNDRVGLGIGWSGVGLNSNISFVPFLNRPIIVNLLFADMTDRTKGGFNTVLSIGVPLNFLN